MEKKWTGAVIFPVTEGHRQKIEEAAPDFRLAFGSLGDLSEEELSQLDVILGNPAPEFLPRLAGLRWLQLNSAGVPGCYLGALPEQALLTNASGAYGPGIAEHMLGMALCLVKRLHQYRDSQGKCRWEDHGQVASLFGTETLVVGFGDIGREFAWRISALGSRVSAVKRTPGEKPSYLAELGALEDLDRLLPQADIVFLALPDTPATRQLFHRDRIFQMKEGAILLNAGRGNVLDLDALCDSLEAGHLKGAGLDVTDPEPLLADHRAWGVENLLLTPHVSGGFHLPYTHDRIVEICVENLRLYQAGKALTHQVNRKEGY